MPLHNKYIKLEKVEGSTATMIEIVDFSPASIIDAIRNIPGCIVSSTGARTFVPYTSGAYQALSHISEHIIDPPSGTSEGSTSKANNASISSVSDDDELTSAPNAVARINDIHTTACGKTVAFNNMQFYIKIPYVSRDIALLKSLEKTYWSSKNALWISKASISNMEQLQAHFGFWDQAGYDKIVSVINIVEKPYKVTLYYLPQTMEKICVKVEGYQPRHDIIKRVAGRSYDKTHQRWLVANEEALITWIKAEYHADGAKVVDKLAKKGKSYVKVKNHVRVWLDHLTRKLSPEKAEALTLYSNALIATSYQATTIKAYCTAIIKYMDALGDLHIAQSTVIHYQAYITSLYDAGASDSMVNTYNSALKYCFKKIYYNSEIASENLIRPRKSRNLPTILSVGQIDRLLRATPNLKHTTILYTLYSSGLRLNEILSLQLQDIWWEREQILVRGKGDKQRVVPLADTLKKLLIKYYEEYKPEYWLFEGQNDNVQYSSSSVRKVIKKCAIKGNISRIVTTHTIRHCYATHLMDAGVGIRYIQELLGHKDIKTTLIYTHVTNVQLSKIQSPLDRLMLGNDNDEA